MQLPQSEHLTGRISGSTSFVFGAALVFAIGYFCLVTWESTRVESRQRAQLIEMTNSFVSAYATNRGEGSPVPATFRRIGIEHFTSRDQEDGSDVHTSVRMPGVPGLEMGTQALDENVVKIIQSFVKNPEHGMVSEHLIVDGRFVGRSYFPSVADSEMCVACHNAALGEGTYEVGDVMGAFVVESDLTNVTRRNVSYSLLAFVVGLASFTCLALRERRRMRGVVDGLKKSVRLEQAKTAAEAQATFLMSHDSLTGLANRSVFTTRIAEDIEAAGKTGFLVALVDMDDFKSVNDTLGHAAGDTLLSHVAYRLEGLIAASGGMVARLGGDEFAISVFPSKVLRDGPSLGEAIVKAISPMLSHENAMIRPRCSVGVVLSNEVDAPSVATLLRAADAALYSAKAAGKNVFRVFDADIRTSLGRRSELSALLVSAIRQDTIGFALQPKVELRSSRFVGFETLARWRPDGVEVSPEEFVQIAEEIGLVRELDLAVMRKSAEFAAQQEAALGLPIPISVNLSAIHFQSEQLIADVQGILEKTGLLPERLTLEVTETTAVKNWDILQTIFANLRKIGVQASLDDFGTGYSSLSYLRRFGFDEIKIDRSFINDIVDDAEERFLFESITIMAMGLGSRVVVEGIETPDQEKIVAGMGEVIGQGYLFAKPLEAIEAEAYLSHQLQSVA